MGPGLGVLISSVGPMVSVPRTLSRPGPGWVDVIGQAHNGHAENIKWARSWVGRCYRSGLVLSGSISSVGPIMSVLRTSSGPGPG